MNVRVERRNLPPWPVRARSTAGRGALAGAILLIILVSVGCGSEGSGVAEGSTTTDPSASWTVIDPYGDLASEDRVRTACALLADTVGPDGLIPVDSSSWRDERERILVDARRESTMLPMAAPGASAELTPDLELLADHASRVAQEISQATSYADAMDRLGSIGADPQLRSAADAVAAWRETNC